MGRESRWDTPAFFLFFKKGLGNMIVVFSHKPSAKVGHAILDSKGSSMLEAKKMFKEKL